MAGFEPQTSGIESDHYANWALTTNQNDGTIWTVLYLNLANSNRVASPIEGGPTNFSFAKHCIELSRIEISKLNYNGHTFLVF